MNEKQFSTDTSQQRARLLSRLQSSSITTLQARQELDILHPAAIVKELREQGHNITTHWTTDTTGKAKHRVGCYVLLVGEQ